MKKKLRSFISPTIVVVIFSSFQINPSLAMERTPITLTDAKTDGMRKMLLVNFDQPLADFRLELTSKGIISVDDIFQNDKGADIIQDYEGEIKIGMIINEENKTLFLKSQKSSSSCIFGDTKSSLSKPNASKYIQGSEPKIIASSLGEGESLKTETSVMATADLIYYSDITLENRNYLFDALKLKSAVNLIVANSLDTKSKEVKFAPSFRTSVTWNCPPDDKYPDSDLIVDHSYCLSKATRELRKSGVTSVTAGAAYLGVGFDTEYKSKCEMLNRHLETEIYLLATHNVRKVELGIQKKYIKASPELEKEIEDILNMNLMKRVIVSFLLKQMLPSPAYTICTLLYCQINNDNLESYKKLISIFEDYGFCVPTKFVLGGQIYCEDTKKVNSVEEAEKAENSFAASVEASFIGGSFSGGGGKVGCSSNTESSTNVQHRITKLVTGGEIGLANDPTKWIASMGPTKSWRVIERDGFIPIIDFLSTSLQYRCKEIICSFYKGDWERISLQAMHDAGKLYATYFLCPLYPSLVPIQQQIYHRFLNGRLVYKPDLKTDNGKIEIPIATLVNPLESTFNLSDCGDAGDYFSISTGYRKKKKAENSNKLEIWLAPRFLLEKHLNTTAVHFQSIYSEWKNKAQVGIFWTWGGWNDLTWCDYIINENMDTLSNINLYEAWNKSRTTVHWFNIGPFHPFRPLPLIINRAYAFRFIL